MPPAARARSSYHTTALAPALDRTRSTLTVLVDVDELVDDVSTRSEEAQEKMVLDASSRSHSPLPAPKNTVEGDSDGSEGSPDSEVAAHQPNHSLYPLLRIMGDPALKLPALDFKGESKYPALPPIAATVPTSSLRSAVSTTGSGGPRVSS